MVRLGLKVKPKEIPAKQAIAAVGQVLLMDQYSRAFKAYGVPGHRHLPEIRQGLSRIAGGQVGLTFVPHLLPLIRGIHATLYAPIKKEADFVRFAGQKAQIKVRVPMTGRKNKLTGKLNLKLGTAPLRDVFPYMVDLAQ